jgi:lysophospholipase L1-like esterase
VLALARARGWRVVGFTPPDGARYLRFFNRNPVIGPRWREFAALMPKLFARYGYRWLDFRDARSIPCRQSDFVDGGYHTDAACSMRMRQRLDAAARRQLTLVALGDSIPAAQPRECHCKAGFAQLFARSLKRPVIVRNLAVPGANSADLLKLLRDHGGVHADIALVMIGHNDTPWVRPHGSLAHNLDAILDLVHAPDVRVANFYDDRHGDPHVVAAYARTICAVAQRHGARCADVYDAFTPNLLAPDHIHPNAAGHRLIAKLLYTASKARSR